MKIFQFNKPKTSDIVIYSIYTLLSVIIFSVLRSTDSHEALKFFKVIMAYLIFTQVLLLHALYVHIRNTTNVIFWLVVGLFHIYLANTLDNDYRLSHNDQQYVGWFVNTFFLVIVLQLLRMVSYIFAREEFVVPFKVFFFDLIDQRKYTFLDALIIALYYGALLGLPMIWIVFF